MLDIEKVAQLTSADVLAVQNWVDTEYDALFAEYFADLHALSRRMSSKLSPITDEELQELLIDLPLKLFSVAENINSLTLKLEVLKLQNKKLVTEKVKVSKESTATLKKDSAEAEIFENKVLELACGSLLDRVQREVAYARELIMGAKKIWDARRRTDVVNPVSEVPPSPNLKPIYT